MSIFSSWLDLDDDQHEPTCDVYELIGEGETWPPGTTMSTTDLNGMSRHFKRGNRPCSCGNRPPIIYQGSHVNPADDHPRGGSIDVAAIPNHCHPDVRGSDGDDMGRPVEFLRLSVDENKTTYGGSQPGSATVVLDRAQVERLRDTLNDWLSTEERY
jgi:hypothetical protein